MQVEEGCVPGPAQQALEQLEKAERRLVKAARALKEAKVQRPEAGLLSEETADILARVRAERAELEASTLGQ